MMNNKKINVVNTLEDQAKFKKFYKIFKLMFLMIYKEWLMI